MANSEDIADIANELDHRKTKLIDLAAHRRFSPVFPLIRRPVEQTLGIDHFNHYYDLYLRKFEAAGRDSERAWKLALETIGVEYRVEAEDLEKVPAKGPLLAVANHPFGGVEGVVMGAMLLEARKDVKILGNYLLKKMEGLADRIIPVDPFGGPDAVKANLRGLKEAMAWLKGGGALVAFPAGEVSSFRFQKSRVEDPPWSSHVAAMARKTKASVLPVFFPGKNSLVFQLAGLFHPRLRTALLPRETVKKSDSQIRAVIGKPISCKRLERFDSDAEAVNYMRMVVYFLNNRCKGRSKGIKAFVPKAVRKKESFKYDIVSPVDPELLEKDVAGLPPESLLIDKGELSVHVAFAHEMPRMTREIGRLRELTFRKVGEGSGKPLDLDRFDDYYRHLFLWNKEQKELAGAYRLGLTDRIIEENGPRGLYTYKLFKFRPGFTDRLGNAIEFGRSFIRPEYQKKFNSLMLLWKGIGEFIARNPRYHMLFGAVSISREYQRVSKNLMVRFLRENRFDDSLSRLVSPRNPFRARRVKGIDREALRSSLKDLDDVSVLISEIEEDGKGIPVLLRQYLKLNGKLLCFNVDKTFSDVVDGLLMVDLNETDARILNKFMGAEGLRKFKAYQEAAFDRDLKGTHEERAA